MRIYWFLSPEQKTKVKSGLWYLFESVPGKRLQYYLFQQRLGAVTL